MLRGLTRTSGSIGCTHATEISQPFPLGLARQTFGTRFTARDQEFYAERGFTEPKRCTPCRNARKAQREGGSAGGGFGGYTGGGSYSAGGYGAPRAPRGPREMHPTTCSDCGKETMVPFLPTSGKPVYCDTCFASRRPAR